MFTWLTTHWFELLETIGIVAGLWFSGATLRFDTKVRQTEINLALIESHRSIWEQMIERPALSRILESHPKVDKEPIKPEERRFVNLVILHVITTHDAILRGVQSEMPGFEDDVRAFLALPIPRDVALSMLDFQTPEARGFLKRLMV